MGNGKRQHCQESNGGAQDKVRAAAGISDEDLHDAIKERDEARRQHVENLGRCLEMHLSKERRKTAK